MQGTIFSLLIIIFFSLGYFFIVFEKFTRIDKTGIALLMSVICWSLIFLNPEAVFSETQNSLKAQFLHVSEITTFILVILIIVEIIQTHEGFDIFKGLIRFRSKRLFLWTMALITFFLSTIIANVTATIIMLALGQKFIPDKESKMIVGAGIVVCANAGGAWTPIGDITTTMLWISDRITTVPVIESLFLPSFCSMIVTLTIFTFMLKGELKLPKDIEKSKNPLSFRIVVLIVGMLALLMIPGLDYFLGLPPYMGALLGASILWILTDIFYREQSHFAIPSILARIDLLTFFFFLGILLSIRSLDTAGWLTWFEQGLNEAQLAPNFIAVILGLASSVLDNVPLVAAAIGMYPLEQFPKDSGFWELLAYCTGVGGSILIIGSPAGISYMNMENVSFIWYLKKATLPIIAGFFAGVLVYLSLL